MVKNYSAPYKAVLEKSLVLLKKSDFLDRAPVRHTSPANGKTALSTQHMTTGNCQAVAPAPDSWRKQ
jgi:hypothetical protein